MVEIGAKSGFYGRIPRWLKILLAAGGVAVLWAIALLIVTAAIRRGVPDATMHLSDLTTLLFGAASLALFIFSILVAGLAIIGYETLKEGAKKDIEASTRERVDMLESEMRGRVLSLVGFTVGAMHSTPDQISQDEHKDFLAQAVEFCQAGYDALKHLTKRGQGRYMALNNLVYFSCLYSSCRDVEYGRPEEILSQARELRRVGHDYRKAPPLLTYCRAVLQYGSDTEVRDALEVARYTLRMNLTESQRKEATFYVASLDRKLHAPPGTTS